MAPLICVCNLALDNIEYFNKGIKPFVNTLHILF